MPFPDTKEALEAAGYVFDNEARCRGCGEAIEWWVSPRGKKCPMSVLAVKKDSSTFAPVVGFKRVSHFSNCVEAASFRKAK